MLLTAETGVVGSQTVWHELIPAALETHELPGGHLDPINGSVVEVWGKCLKDSLLRADQVGLQFLTGVLYDLNELETNKQIELLLDTLIVS